MSFILRRAKDCRDIGSATDDPESLKTRYAPASTWFASTSPTRACGPLARLDLVRQAAKRVAAMSASRRSAGPKSAWNLQGRQVMLADVESSHSTPRSRSMPETTSGRHRLQEAAHGCERRRHLAAERRQISLQVQSSSRASIPGCWSAASWATTKHQSPGADCRRALPTRIGRTSASPPRSRWIIWPCLSPRRLRHERGRKLLRRRSGALLVARSSVRRPSRIWRTVRRAMP